MIFKDYYKILGLNTNKVSVEDIKIAFREQAKKYHPDVNKQARNAEERFKDINEAYKILTGTNTRRRYDRQWNARIGKKIKKQQKKTGRNNNTNIISEFKTIFFGQKQEAEKKVYKHIPIKGENVETEINVKLEDAYFGLEKKLSLRTVNGKMKTFNIKIPAGIRNGEKIRLIGQGKKGTDGGKNGDLFIRVNILKDKTFTLNGCDIITDLYISPWEAALGKKVNVDSIDDSISIQIPPGIQSGERIKIPQKGYKDGQGGRGYLIANIKTVVPKSLTEEEKDLFEKLREISTFNPRG